MKAIGGLAVIGSILIALTTATVPRELGLEPNQAITVYGVAIAVGLAGIWLLLRRTQA